MRVGITHTIVKISCIVWGVIRAPTGEDLHLGRGVKGQCERDRIVGSRGRYLLGVVLAVTDYELAIGGFCRAGGNDPDLIGLVGFKGVGAGRIRLSSNFRAFADHRNRNVAVAGF